LCIYYVALFISPSAKNQRREKGGQRRRRERNKGAGTRRRRREKGEGRREKGEGRREMENGRWEKGVPASKAIFPYPSQYLTALSSSINSYTQS
jgi:hypothetical protein